MRKVSLSLLRLCYNVLCRLHRRLFAEIDQITRERPPWFWLQLKCVHCVRSRNESVPVPTHRKSVQILNSRTVLVRTGTPRTRIAPSPRSTLATMWSLNFINSLSRISHRNILLCRGDLRESSTHCLVPFTSVWWSIFLFFSNGTL